MANSPTPSAPGPKEIENFQPRPTMDTDVIRHHYDRHFYAPLHPDRTSVSLSVLDTVGALCDEVDRLTPKVSDESERVAAIRRLYQRTVDPEMDRLDRAAAREQLRHESPELIEFLLSQLEVTNA